jgi:hypothetical protein
MRTEPEPKPKPYGPEESPEARLAKAKQLDAELRRVVADLRQGQRDMFATLAAAVGLPGESDRSRLIWEGLVRFVNKDLKGLPADIDVFVVLRAVIALCVYGNSEFEDMQENVYGLGVFTDVYHTQQRGNLSVDQAFAVLATELQPKFRLLLSWIADPNLMDREGRRAALQFLIEHGEQELAQYDYDPNDDFDDTGNVGASFFFWKRPASFESVVTPIARFIYERLEQYHNSELELPDAVPIVLCKREGCGKISIIQRKTKDFCSSSCRTLHRQKEKAAEHAAYMRDYRAKNHTKPFPSRKTRRT